MIRRVWCYNFMSFQSLNIEFRQHGLTQIDGEVMDEAHADNNGVGKTAVLDLIIWTLYGHLRRADKVDEIVNSKTGKDCVGVVDIETRFGWLNVARYRKHHEFKNELQVSLDGTPITATDTKEMQRQIEHYIGMDAKTFMRSMIFDGSMSLAKMTDGDAKDFLERLLGLDLSKWHSASKEYEKTCQAKLQEAQEAVRASGVRLQSLNTQINDLTVRSEAWETEATERRATLDQAKQTAEYDLLNHHEPNLKVARAEVGTLEGQISTVQAEVQQFALNVNQYNALQGAVTQQTATERIARAAVTVATTNRNNFEESGVACLTCGQALPADQSVRIAVEYNRAVTATCDELEAASRALNDAQYKLNDAKVPHDAPARAEQLQALQSQLNSAHATVRNYQQTVTRYQTEVNGYTNELGRLGSNPFADTLAKAASDQIDARLAHEAGEGQVTWWNGHVEACAATSKMFSREGLRSYVLDMLLPFLNERLHYYLGRLTDGAITADFNTTTNTGRERFNIVVNRKHGGSSYASLSQGERARLDLAMTLATLDHIRTKVTTPIVFFDELFDALDATGVERVINVLREISSNCAIVLISHNPAIKTYVDDVIRIVKEDGVSRVQSD